MSVIVVSDRDAYEAKIVDATGMFGGCLERRGDVNKMVERVTRLKPHEVWKRGAYLIHSCCDYGEAFIISSLAV